MKSKILFSLLCLGILMSSCRKDELTTTTSDPIIPNPSYTYESSVSGIITDESGNAISDAVVKISSRTANTDQNGYFKISNIEIDADGSYMTITKSGFFNGYKFVSAVGNQRSHIRAQMVARDNIASFNSTDGASVTMADGATITIAANAIQNADGSSYTGNVNVYAHWYDPTDQLVNGTMPGDLRALNLENQLVQLSTYGMIAVELISDSGSKLQLLEGTEANISLPVPSELQANAPSEIALWHFDEASGYWMEDGSASLIDGSYVGTVSHFSFWNCDAPFPVVPLTGQLQDIDGNPLIGYALCIDVVGSSLTGYGWTDQFGYFTGKVPSNKELILKVKNQCGEVIKEEAIGPFNTATDIGIVSVDLGNNGLLITAQLLDCNNMPLMDGYAVLNTTDGYYQYFILEPDENGNVSASINTCNEYTVNFYAYDPINLLESDLIEVSNTNGNVLDLGAIVVCESIEEYITFSIDGGEVNLITDPSLSIGDGTDYFIDGYQSTNTNGLISFNALLNNVNINTPLNASKVTGQGFTSGNIDYFFCQESGQNTSCTDLFFTVTNTGAIGDFIEGTFSGTISSELNQQGVSIEGAFRIILDNTYNTGSISGMAWEDENSNGIRDNGELPLENKFFYLQNIDSIAGGIINTTSITGPDGMYSFTGLIPNQEYIIFVEGQNSALTSMNTGSDSTIDSDFNQNSYRTGGILLGDGENIENIDAGFLTALPLSCFVYAECDFIEVSVVGGIAPYTFTLEGNGTLETSGQPSFFVPGAGIYTITVIDASGQTCTEVVTSNGIGFTEIQGIVWEDQAGGMANLYDQGVDLLVPGVEVSIVDNFGNIFDETVTGTNGQYYFNFVSNGNNEIYYLSVTTPMGYTILDQNVGQNDNIDNDIDPTTGLSEELFLPACESNFYNIDVGLTQ